MCAALSYGAVIVDLVETSAIFEMCGPGLFPGKNNVFSSSASMLRLALLSEQIGTQNGVFQTYGAVFLANITRLREDSFVYVVRSLH